MKKMLFLLGLFSFCSSLTSCDSLGTNSPKLVGFYIEGERVSITENSSVRNTIKYQNGNASSEQAKEETDVITQEMLANPQEKVIVTLQFINEVPVNYNELFGSNIYDYDDSIGHLPEGTYIDQNGHVFTVEDANMSKDGTEIIVNDEVVDD